MRIAIVHDWLTGHRGGERVLERLLSLWPSADLFTLFHARGSVPESIESRKPRTSWLQHVPGLRSHYRLALPLFPHAIESLDLRGFDAVIASSHCVAHGVRTDARATKLALIYSPARYAWDLEDEYLTAHPARLVARPLLAAFRDWDRRAAQGPHSLIAISQHVAQRVRRHWNRDAVVVHPGIALARFAGVRSGGEHYLVLGALTPGKRAHVAIEACAQLGRPLIVAGEGPLAGSLRRIAPRDCRFLGAVAESDVPGHYANARALLFPGVEDFGLVPIEAMAAGCPVIALAQGGALESVGRERGANAERALAEHRLSAVAGGVLFADSGAAALAAAIRAFESCAFESDTVRLAAAPFSHEQFDRAFLAAVRAVPGGDALVAAAAISPDSARVPVATS